MVRTSAPLQTLFPRQKCLPQFGEAAQPLVLWSCGLVEQNLVGQTRVPSVYPGID
jgi:hypothetical protein